ncbi:MAG TPA: gephyrin-like molybdotransferase Glp [Verrucomicrobiae bacterium]|nr:gephyrin-like molybdotransferase Glp [Verrucomicrobiae bacterium]
MLTVTEARDIILVATRSRAGVAVPLADALDCVLASDVASTINLPLWDNSSVDGYAVRAADVSDANENNPIHLRVIAEVPAGSSTNATIEPQTCSRIFTGAPIPEGADAVVMQEDTHPHHEGYIAVTESVDPGDNIRRAGNDVASGDVVLRAGTLVGPPQLGLAAALGSTQLTIHPRPRVGVLVTGAEIIEPGRPLRAGQIYDANSYAVTALVKQAGCEPVELGIADDTREDLNEKIDYGLSECDAVITVGGVSVGEHDLVKDVLTQLGCEQKFWKIAMRPGKPFVFATREPKLVFGLPGNPVSAAVTFLMLVRPALQKMRGLTDIDLPTLSAEAAEDFVNTGDRVHYMRASLQRHGDKWLVKPMPNQGAHALASFAGADCLVEVPESATIPSGQSVRTIRLSACI